MRSTSMRTAIGRTTAVIACLLGASCGDDSIAALVHEESIIDAALGEQYLGGACEEIGANSSLSSTGAGGDGLPPYSIVHQNSEAGVEVIVHGEDGRVLLSKEYGVGFLLSGEVDDFVVRIGASKQLRLRYWGGQDCASAPPFRSLGS